MPDKSCTRERRRPATDMLRTSNYRARAVGPEVDVDYVTMGRSGLKVSRNCLGAMNFGTTDAPCGEDGGPPHHRRPPRPRNNFIDTANVYTGGQSEEVVGRAIKSKRLRRPRYQGARRQGPGPNDSGLSASPHPRPGSQLAGWAPITSTSTSATQPTPTRQSKKPWQHSTVS